METISGLAIWGSKNTSAKEHKFKSKFEASGMFSQKECLNTQTVYIYIYTEIVLQLVTWKPDVVLPMLIFLVKVSNTASEKSMKNKWWRDWDLKKKKRRLLSVTLLTCLKTETWDINFFGGCTSGGVYVHACQVRVTVGESGVHCCTCVTYSEC